MKHKMFNLLQRVTASGRKILYIDGLRFFAVVSVFIFHFIDFYTDHHNDFLTDWSHLKGNLQGSVMGVILFFAISGFLIAIPFYNAYVIRDGHVSLRHYYFRRLTRLEPPYIIHLVILLFLMVFILKTKTMAEVFPHFLASLFYVHEIVYKEMPLLNTVLWTLEIEIQFYLSAPLLALIFKLKALPRRLIFLSILIIFTFCKPIDFGFPTVFHFIHYFIVGFLALDIFMTIKQKLGKYLLFDGLCFSSILFLWFSTKDYWTLIFLFVLLAFSAQTVYFIKILENKFIYTIGGMCYSIYMLHQKIIYLVYSLVTRELIIGQHVLVDFFCRMLLTFAAVVLISSIFFIFIERPTMKKEWWRYRSWKKLFFT